MALVAYSKIPAHVPEQVHLQVSSAKH